MPTEQGREWELCTTCSTVVEIADEDACNCCFSARTPNRIKVVPASKLKEVEEERNGEQNQRLAREADRQAEQERADNAESQLEAERAKLAGLVEALSECIDLAEEGWAYASDFFREKWEFDKEIAKARAALSKATEGQKRP